MSTKWLGLHQFAHYYFVPKDIGHEVKLLDLQATVVNGMKVVQNVGYCSLISNQKNEIKRKTAITKTVVGKINRIWKNHDIIKATKLLFEDNIFLICVGIFNEQSTKPARTECADSKYECDIFNILHSKITWESLYRNKWKEKIQKESINVLHRSDYIKTNHQSFSRCLRQMAGRFKGIWFRRSHDHDVQKQVNDEEDEYTCV